MTNFNKEIFTTGALIFSIAYDKLQGYYKCIIASPKMLNLQYGCQSTVHLYLNR